MFRLPLAYDYTSQFTPIACQLLGELKGNLAVASWHTLPITVMITIFAIFSGHMKNKHLCFKVYIYILIILIWGTIECTCPEKCGIHTGRA